MANTRSGGETSSMDQKSTTKRERGRRTCLPSFFWVFYLSPEKDPLPQQKESTGGDDGGGDTTLQKGKVLDGPSYRKGRLKGVAQMLN